MVPLTTVGRPKGAVLGGRIRLIRRQLSRPACRYDQIPGHASRSTSPPRHRRHGQGLRDPPARRRVPRLRPRLQRHHAVREAPQSGTRRRSSDASRSRPGQSGSALHCKIRGTTPAFWWWTASRSARWRHVRAQAAGRARRVCARGHRATVVLGKPQSFMNLSGQPAASLRGYYKVEPTDEHLVVHDDVDLPFGERPREEGRRAMVGHNGLRDLKAEAGRRLRSGPVWGRAPTGLVGTPRTTCSDRGTRIEESAAARPSSSTERRRRRTRGHRRGDGQAMNPVNARARE